MSFNISTLVGDIASRLRNANWYHLAQIIFLGQILSLSITATSLISNKLAELQSTSVPNFQSFLVYALLFVVYMPIAIVRLGPRVVWLNIRRRFYWYIILAVVDVEANFFVIKAYSYTSLLSCMLLDTWTTPCAVCLSFLLLRVRYGWTQILGVLICLGGMGIQIKGDMDAGKNYTAVDALKGDLFMLLGATLYACSNVVEEFIVRHRSQHETIAWLGFFGTIINGVQMGIIEHEQLRTMTWSKEVIGLIVGFGLVMFVLYSLAPILFRKAGATFYNLSLLTSDFYGLIFAKYMLHDKITYLNAIAFVMIVAGLVLYHVIRHPSSRPMPKLPGFREPLPGDIEITPGTHRVAESEMSSVASSRRASVDYGSTKSVRSIQDDASTRV